LVILKAPKRNWLALSWTTLVEDYMAFDNHFSKIDASNIISFDA
jgi:hypothetical protein